MSQLLSYMDARQVVAVVVGLPLDEQGAEGDAARAARALAEDIARRSGRPVELWDERMTTARVRQAIHEMGGKIRGRAADVDALAATLLLQHYLDAKRGSAV
jgi:putative holliday junction resolvase